MTITVYGSSDDLIEVEGDISEEFNPPFNEDDTPSLLAFSDGTVLSVDFGNEGIWRIEHVTEGSAGVEIDKNPPDDGDRYSDVATVDDAASFRPITWVASIERLVRAKA